MVTKVKSKVVKRSHNRNGQSKPYTLASGEEITVHSVPSLVIHSVIPDVPKPVKPTIEMKTMGGKQPRDLKKGDEGWDKYVIDLTYWEDEKAELEDAVTKVMALRDYKLNHSLTILKATEADFEFPEYIEALIESGALLKPKNIWRLKAMWLDSEVLTQQDEIEITWILQELNGVPEEMIEQMKSSFRNTVLGKDVTGMDGDSQQEFETD